VKKFTSIAALGAIGIALSAVPSFAAVSTNNDADIVEGNAFVRSSWVQAGLKQNGSFGSTVSVPSGYNSLLLDFDDTDEDLLGLIADTDENGFGSNDDGGDFFLPGSPYEAWGIKVDDNDNLVNDDGSTDIPGSWVSSETTGDASVTWESTSAADGIEVTQVVSTPAAGGHFVTVTVTLQNVDSAAHTVYYARQVDADNGVDPMLRDNYDEGLDGYSTFNRVMSNTAASQLVTSTHYYNFTTIGYRATDANAAVRISDWEMPLTEASNSVLDDFREDYRVGFQDNLDSTIDLIFRKEIAAGASSTFSFDYILSPTEAGVPELALDLALDLEVGGSYSGASTNLSGGGLAPNSTYTLTEFSVPMVLFTGTTLPNGNFYDSVDLPVDCRPGSHTLVLTGTSPAGVRVSDLVTYTLDDTCTVTAFDPYAAANGAPNPDVALADTGADSGQLALLGGLAALSMVAGAAVVVRRRKA
jgi:LPXTG-motif cell wall-anchored protein